MGRSDLGRYNFGALKPDTLRRALYMYSGAIGLSRFENEEYSLCFAIRGIHVFRAKNMHCL